MHIISIRLAVAFFVGSVLGGTPAAAARQSDAQIRQAIIRESIANYPGRCPCPYNSKSNGYSCGGSSAWSRKGGYAPKCYPGDVSKAEVEEYRRH